MSTTLSAWKQFRYRLEEWGCLLLEWGLPKLPRGACVRLANALGTLTFFCDRRGRAVALANLECAYQERYSPAQRRNIARASYQNFARTMLDLFWGQRLTAENFSRWIKIEGAEAMLERMAREKRGAIMMCVHQGNWEWASLANGFLGVSATIVTENFKNPRLNPIFARMREHSGHRIIPQENSILRLLKIVKRGGTSGMLIDLSLAPSKAATVVEAFGMKSCVPVLHAVFAQRSDALLVPVYSYPQPDGTVHVVVQAGMESIPGESLQDIAQRCWDVMEPLVDAHPHLYLWPYKHFRYQPRGAATAYPFYANVSGKFEKHLKTLQNPEAPMK